MSADIRRYTNGEPKWETTMGHTIGQMTEKRGFEA
jgi:hypothetical protein